MKFVTGYAASPLALKYLPSYSNILLHRHRGVARLPALLHSAGAHRAAGFLHSCAGVHHRFPDVPLAAAPPCLACAPAGHILRRQIAVECRMPLLCQLRLHRGKIVIPCQHPAVRAIRALACPHRPRGDRRLILMLLFAPPPYDTVAARRHHLRRKRTVFRRMPLCFDGRMARLQIVFSCEYRFALAHRAAAPVRAVSNARAPFVSPFAPPPHPARCVRGHVPRRKRTVFSLFHSAAISGNNASRSFVPFRIVRPAHAGHPVFCTPARDLTIACHAWPQVLHCHHTFVCELGEIASGRSGAFFSAIHSAALRNTSPQLCVLRQHRITDI